MSGFRDTFTKEDGKDGLLGYDDTAFYYFASCVLFTLAVPWTYSVIKSLLIGGTSGEAEAFLRSKKRSGSAVRHCKTSAMTAKATGAKDSSGRSGTTAKCLLIQVVVLVLIWASLFLLVARMGGEKQISKFDPFEILEVSPSANDKEIKKAYRKLSLLYHPDRNPDDPLAQSRFIQLTKAHAALTDDAARANYEKYGNPDGPQTTKVGIGLPRFLLEKDNQLMILCAFFFFLLFVVPMTFICYYQRTKNYAANGVMIETLQFMGFKVNESTRVKNCPELLGASAESRGMEGRPTDNKEMTPLFKEIVEHKKCQYQNYPIIMKNSSLVWAHMQRLHHLMTPQLRSDLDQLLKYSMKITQAMIEIACMREWFFTAQAMIDFRRSLVQALDAKSSQLLQIPHFTEETIKHCHKGKNSVSTLPDFLAKDPEQRKGLSTMEPQQILDIEAFAMHVSDMEMTAEVEVEDEKEIVVGDIATVSVKMTRKNLQEGEAVGPVHAPLFPEAKYEEWWIFLVEGSPSTRIITYERIRSTERVFEEKLRFQISRPGKHKLDLHVLCDSYAGLDKKVELNFNACQESEVKRDVFVHKEDEDLDLQPTLFQQFMGDFGQEEESEEEEEDDDKQKAKPVKKDLGESAGGPDTGSKDESDDEDDGKKGGKDDDDDSSASSSDSD